MPLSAVYRLIVFSLGKLVTVFIPFPHFYVEERMDEVRLIGLGADQTVLWAEKLGCNITPCTLWHKPTGAFMY